MTKSDPTKDLKFQQVVQTFLRTPPKPHKPVRKKRDSAKPQVPKDARNNDLSSTWGRAGPEAGLGWPAFQAPFQSQT
jgi:hypothetical protein